jgi:hypothetical protein
MQEHNVTVGVAGLDLNADEFVDAALSYKRGCLVEAVDELKGHQLYIIAARETVNEWENHPTLINPGYLAVVKDILSTAERILGICYEPSGRDDGETAGVSAGEGVRE